MKTRFYFISILFSLAGVSQEQDSVFVSPQFNLQEVTIIGNRLQGNADIAPIAVTLLDSTLISQPVQQLSIKEQLLQVPGLYIQNANNFAQDARISIRGFGANAAFGIRGIKLIVDGIPETTPDGTGQLDNLNLDQLGSIQVIRGASSSLYGNASGGAILLNSKRVTNDFLTYHAMFGSYGFYSQALSGGLKNQKATYQANVRAFGSDGYREHSSFSQVNARFATHQQFSEKVSAVFLAEYVDSPKAQDAGGLTLEASDMDFRQARDRNLTFNAGESITQWKVGTSIKWEFSESSRLNSYLFFNQRNFNGRLPFENSGTIELERDYFGFGNSLDVAKGIHRFKLGYDLLNQSDNRQRFNNLNGTQGPLALSQEESFLNAGFFVLDHLEWQDWVVTAGLRFDVNELEVEDRFLSDGNDSGSINMNNWSYQLGVGRRMFSNAQLFANHSTNFETPTLAQLSNRPDNTGGFEDLEAATARNYEVGIRWNASSLELEVTGFITNTEDELVPFELEAFPERTFFRNAGKTSRKGLELSANYQSSVLDVYGSFSFSDFTFDDFEENGNDLDGFRLPGLPNQFGSLNLSLHPFEGFDVSIPVQYVGSLWADNENTTKVDDYLEVSAMASYRFKVNKVQFVPFVGIRNLTGQRYFDNIRINAFGSRHYEPAPGRNVYGGIKVSI